MTDYAIAKIIYPVCQKPFIILDYKDTYLPEKRGMPKEVARFETLEEASAKVHQLENSGNYDE